MAELIKIDKNGSKHFKGMVTCPKCMGVGLIVHHMENGQPSYQWTDGGVCWKCGGSGKVIGKWIERTPEYQAKLDAKRQAKLDALMKQREEEDRLYQLKLQKEKEEKERQEALEKARKAISQYIGEVGQKIEIECCFEKTAWFDCRMGWKEERIYIHTFKDVNGNKLVWKTSSKGNLGLNYGEPLILKGTVKDHSEYQEEKQTYLIRCKIQKVGV